MKLSNLKIDFSFIPSLECNIECPFCMYDAGPKRLDILDIEKTKIFVKKIDWNLIENVGFYGGEPSINLSLYQKYIDLVPRNIKKFIITNGSWSTDKEKTNIFIEFLKLNNFYLIVSGTPFHKKHQDLEVLKSLKEKYVNSIRLKGDDIIHPMGRAFVENWTCLNKCENFNIPIRMGLFPDGNILFQICDGIYPKVQTYLDDFEGIYTRIEKTIKKCKERNK